jgi:hypothetical protein
VARGGPKSSVTLALNESQIRPPRFGEGGRENMGDKNGSWRDPRSDE